MRARGFVDFRLTPNRRHPLVPIPQGTVVRTFDGKRFQTRWNYAIDVNEIEVTIEVEAMVHGQDHNVRAGEIVLIEGSLPLHVHNLGAMHGGSDDEVERALPAPTADPLMGGEAQAWNYSIYQIGEAERGRRQRDPHERDWQRLERARRLTPVEQRKTEVDRHGRLVWMFLPGAGWNKIDYRDSPVTMEVWRD